MYRSHRLIVPFLVATASFLVSLPAAQADPLPSPAPTGTAQMAGSAVIRRDLPAPRLLNRRTLLSRHMSQFRGAHYRFGAASLRATDCSGLTMQLYSSIGIHLPHSARSQFHYGKSVAKKDLLPGDLVFFNTRGGISHVGMYIGNGNMFHAANPRKGLRIDALSSRYYARHYVGARRLLPEGAAPPATPPAPMGNGEPPSPEVDSFAAESYPESAIIGKAAVLESANTPQ